MALQFEAFCAGGLARLEPDGAGTGRLRRRQFEISFLTDTGDMAFHVKPRLSSVTVAGSAFQGGRWGQEEVSSVFPLALGGPFEIGVSADAEHFRICAQEHKVWQFPHRHWPLATITRVRVLSDHQLAQVELPKRSLNWGDIPTLSSLPSHQGFLLTHRVAPQAPVSPSWFCIPAPHHHPQSSMSGYHGWN